MNHGKSLNYIENTQPSSPLQPIPDQDYVKMVHKVPIEFTLDTDISKLAQILWLTFPSLSIHGKVCYCSSHLLNSMSPAIDLTLHYRKLHRSLICLLNSVISQRFNLM